MAKPTKDEVKRALDEFILRCEDAPKEYLEHLIYRKYIDCDIDEMWVDYEIILPPESVNHIGTIHGGYIAAVADEAMAASAAVLAGDPDMTVTTLDFQMNTIKAMHVGEKIRLHCTTDHVGKRTVLAHAVFYRGTEVCAMATENFARLSKSRITWVEFKKQ